MSDLLDFSPPGQVTFSLSGAKARFYDAGTTNPRTVFFDQAQTIPVPVPLLADSDGLFDQVFVAGGAVKVVVTQADDSTGYTLDPCVKVAATGSAANAITFSPSVLRPYTNVQDAIDLGTFPPRTITGAGIVNVTNGDGQAGNPTIAVAPITTAEIAAATLVTSSETIASNNNDTTIPTSAAVLAHNITLGTTVNATGASVDFTGIPSWVKRIKVLFVAVSTNGTSGVQVQIGDAGGIENTGYFGATTVLGAGAATFNLSAGFLLNYDAAAAATNVRYGAITISRVGGNVWAAEGVVSLGETTRLVVLSGAKELSAALDRLRVTTVSGVDTFDAGTLTISWE